MKGFGLLEAMIALSLTAIGWVLFIAQMNMGARNSRTNVLDQEWNQIIWSLENTLHNTGLCTAVLNGKGLGPITYTDPAGFTLVAGTTYNDWAFTKVDLVQSAPGPFPPPYIDLFLQAMKTGAYLGSPVRNTKIQNIRVMYGTNITGCW